MRINAPSDLGTVVRRARRAQQLRQEDLALVTGVGVRFIGDLERGKRSVEIGKVLRVLAALGLLLDVDDSVIDDDA
jgi:y4mF family transcriptional regulator